MSPHDRPFRFGVELQAPFEGRTWTDSARELEDLGYSTLFVPDHVHSPYGPIAAMAAALAATDRLCVAPLVMAVDFRNPVFLAKEIATLDVMFPGRVELGVGAGYNALDYSRAGIPMHPPGRRVTRLTELVQIMRLLFAGEEFTFDGAEFHLEAVTGSPAPASVGGPRILVAGGGPRLLRVAGAAADIVGVNPSTAAGRDSVDTLLDAMPSSIDAKVALVRAAAGDRWDSLELNAWISTARLTDDAAGMLQGLADFAGVSLDEVLGSPVVLVGTEDDVVERLVARRARWGYSYTCLPQVAARSFAPVVQRLAGR